MDVYVNHPHAASVSPFVPSKERSNDAALPGLAERDRLIAKLRERWNLALAKEGINAEAGNLLFAHLTLAYSEVFRHYHTLRHLSEMFDALRMFGDVADSPDVIFAGFFHDVVYRARDAGNEERSAERCRGLLKELGVSASTIESAERLILCTKTHQAKSAKEKAFVDSDLMILAAPHERYLEYARAIRREYAFVPHDAYISGRCSVLETFVKRKPLFSASPQSNILDEQARENILLEIQLLRTTPEVIMGSEKQRLEYEWPSRVIAVTGTIGSGKSALIRECAALGAFTVSADELVKDLYGAGGPLLGDLVQILGADIIDADGNVDRKKAAQAVFGDREKKALVEQIVHPLVHEKASRAFVEAVERGEQLLVYELPLLFECGLENLGFKKTVVVTAADETCVERIVKRSGGRITIEEARRRIQIQMPAAEKAAKADLVINNTGTLEELRREVEKLLNKVSY